jgi:hypothetical protein
MDLSKKVGSADVDLYQYDKCAVAFIGVCGGILCGVLVLATFFLLFSIRVLLHYAVPIPRPILPLAKTTHVSLKNRFVILSFRSARCLTHVRGAELLPSFLFFECLRAAHAHVQCPYWKWWKWFQHVVKDNESERDANTVPS